MRDDGMWRRWRVVAVAVGTERILTTNYPKKLTISFLSQLADVLFDRPRAGIRPRADAHDPRCMYHAPHRLTHTAFAHEAPRQRQELRRLAETLGMESVVWLVSRDCPLWIPKPDATEHLFPTRGAPQQSQPLQDVLHRLQLLLHPRKVP